MTFYSLYHVPCGQLMGWRLHHDQATLPECESADWFCGMCSGRLHRGSIAVRSHEGARSK